MLLAPALVGASTLVARRAGPRAGGVASAFPAIVGPVLLIDLLEHGERFTARAATGTLLGLVTLAAFVAAYARVASRGPGAALAAGWAAAGVAGLALSGVETTPLVAAAAAAVALVLAARVTPDVPVAATARTGGVAWRMAAAAVLVVALAAAADAVGPVAGGVLAALPVLASVLAAATHRDDGPAAAVALLRGTLTGLLGFGAFCLTIALLVAHVPPALAFALATLAALVPLTRTARR